jgi:hypothetical protein
MYFGEPMKRPVWVRSSPSVSEVLHEAEVEHLHEVALVAVRTR